MFKTHELTFRLKRELELKRRPTASKISESADLCGAKKIFNSNGSTTYHWSEESYQKLKSVFEE